MTEEVSIQDRPRALQFQGGWHPIETAPKDQTYILFIHKMYAWPPVIGFYHDGHIWTGGICGYHPSAIPREWSDVAKCWMPLPPTYTAGGEQ